jgi:hypothetical protein
MATGEIKPQEKEDDCDDEDLIFNQDIIANSRESAESPETPCDRTTQINSILLHKPLLLVITQ